MKRIIAIAIAIAALLAAVVFACAPDFPRAVFVYQRHPDFPRTGFLNGNLGVFQPTYARSYLVIAYRYLSNKPLSAVEKQQVLDYWKDRATGSWDHTDSNWIAKWSSERMRVPGARPPKQNSISQGQYRFDQQNGSFLVNCAEDAYRTAYDTLRDRSRRFGIASPAVKSWLDAQDDVFSNCGDAQKIPAAAAPALPQIIKYDRDYQIAAAHFYAGQYPEAATQFRTIAATRESPWRWIAPYLIVRGMTRAARNDSELPAARAAAQKILDDPQLVSIHGMTRVLLHRMILRQGDENYLHQLARDLASGRNQHSVREELWDYTTDLDGYLGSIAEEPPKTPPDPAIFAADDMSDWIYTFQLQNGGGAKHAAQRWRETHSLPWLIAAMKDARADSPSASAMIDAAGRIAPAHPAYLIANFHRLRLMIDANKTGEARAELDQILSSNLPKSTVNAFRSLRMRAAPDLDNFLAFAGRTPLLIADYVNNREEVPEDWFRATETKVAGRMLLDRDSIKILNERTPIRLWREAALSGSVPEYARRDFVLTAFTRALVLDDMEDAAPLASKLTEIRADPSGYLKDFASASSNADRRFAGVFYILHHPEARTYLASGVGRDARDGSIESYRDNWWCPVDIKVELDARPQMEDDWPPKPARENPDSASWSALS